MSPADKNRALLEMALTIFVGICLTAPVWLAILLGGK